MISKTVARFGARAFTLVGVALSLPACATMTRGTTQELTVDSTPPGAQATTSNGFECAATPCTFRMSRKGNTIASAKLVITADGGFRRGTDVIKALALGANAVCIGRPYVWGLAAFGEPGVTAVLAIMLLTGSLAALGTAPVPSASLFMLAAVLSAVGVAPEQTALVVGFVLPFDRLLDMTRTVPSASANLAVATTVARLECELDQNVYRASPLA